MDYRDWRIKRWRTPVSDASQLFLLSLCSAGYEMRVLVEDEQKRRYEFTFQRLVAYRNIYEEFRTRLWEVLHKDGQRLGSTLEVEAPNWVTELAADEPLVTGLNPEVRHYIICTEDDVVEVLTATGPQVLEVSAGAL